MKCSQCGGIELAEVAFPQETSLILTEVGLVGETNAYEIKNHVRCNSYICLNCGHFEFFNLALAEQIKADLKIIEDTKKNIDKIESEIANLNEDIVNKHKEIDELESELQNLDITVRRINEIKELISGAKSDIVTIKGLIREKEMEINKLKQTLRIKNSKLKKVEKYV